MKAIGPPTMGGTFSTFPACVRALTSVFEDALVRADHAEKRVSELEERCKGYQLCLSRLEKDLQVSKLHVNKYILCSKSLKLKLDGERRKLLQLDLLLNLRIKIIRRRSPKLPLSTREMLLPKPGL